MVSPNAFHKQLRQFGLPLKETGDYYGYSLALGQRRGVAAVAGQCLPRSGEWRTPWSSAAAASTGCKVLPGVTSGQAIDARVAFIVSDILSDPMARAPTFGLDSVLATRYWSAVKTGTSKDMRDNWALGYSQRYTVGVWVGNASGAPMHDVSGTTGAAPIWLALMNHLHAHQPSACRPRHRRAWCVWMLRSQALKRRAPSGLSVAPSKPSSL
jgi:penicillin-binding protein 1C